MSIDSDSSEIFEAAIGQLTRPVNGQFPRPWMTRMRDPRLADVFVIGRNQRNGYPDDLAGGHARHVNALFNRHGESCRGLYDEVTGGKASRTRQNTDHFVSLLAGTGVTNVLETNVICYSSLMSADLRLETHEGGAERGDEIFRFLLDSIKPKAIIVHGTGAAKALFKVLEIRLNSKPEPASVNDLVTMQVDELLIVVIRSLAPPAYNKWSRWADGHLRLVAEKISEHLGKCQMS